MMRWFVCYLYGCFCFSTIQIEGARFRPFRLAVYPVVLQEMSLRAPYQIVIDVLKNDLEYALVFEILNPKSFLAKDTPKTPFTQIVPEHWTQIGAEGLVKLALHQTAMSAMEMEVYLVHVGDQKEKLYKKYKLDRGQERRLAHQIANDVFYYFTGEQGHFLHSIVAAKLIGNRKQLVVMDMDGRNERVLTNEPEGVLLPSFAPDGKTILYSTYKNYASILKEINIATKATRKVSAYPGLNIGGIYEPGQKSILVTLSKSGKSDVYRLNAKGEQPVQLTRSTGIDTSAFPALDGKKIAFVSSRSGSPQIYEMQSNGSDPKRLTFEGNYNQSPRISPNVQWLVFVGRDDKGVFDLFLKDRKTLRTLRITQNQGNNEDPSFAPNSRLILFTSNRLGKNRRDICFATPDGSKQSCITKGGYYDSPTLGKLP